VKTDAPENEDQNLITEKIKSSMNSDLQNVYVRAFDGNTWLSYKIDNNPIESVIISKGNDLFLQGNEIRLFLGNVNVTKIFYNNYLIETPTKSGVKSLVFPEESNEKYFLPLFPKAKDDILYTAEEYQKRMKLEEDEIEKRKQ
jgi:cytoskeleton protein RodZ